MGDDRTVGAVQIDPFDEVTGGVSPVDGAPDGIYGYAHKGRLHVLDENVRNNGFSVC